MRDTIEQPASEHTFQLDSPEALSAEERQTLSIARLITASPFIAASLFLLLIMMRVLQQAAASTSGTSSGTSGGQAGLSSVVILQLGWSTAMLFSTMGYPILRGAATRALVRIRPENVEDTAADNALIARGYLTATIIGAGLAEGLSLFGTIILLMSGRLFNITLAAVPLLAFVFIIPTTRRLLKFRRNIHETVQGRRPCHVAADGMLGSGDRNCR